MGRGRVNRGQGRELGTGWAHSGLEVSLPLQIPEKETEMRWSSSEP